MAKHGITRRRALAATAAAGIIPAAHAKSPARGGGGTSAALPVPVVTSSSQSATQGTFFSYQIVATNSPTSYNATGLTGTGLSVNTSTGMLSGTPPTVGPYTIGLSATNASGTGNGTLSLTISAAGATISYVTLPIANLGTFASGGYENSIGMQIQIGSQPITLTQAGRYKSNADNISTHTINIFPVPQQDGLTVPGGTTTFNMAGGTVGQFVYGTLQGPTVLNAGATYYLLCTESPIGVPGDSFYQNAVCTVTSAATLLGGIDARPAGTTGGDPYPAIHLFSVPNQQNGPLDFKYTVGALAVGTIISAGGYPFSAAPLGQIFAFEGSTGPAVSGTAVVLRGRFPIAIPPGPAESWTWRYKLTAGDGTVRYSPYLTGAVGQDMSTFDLAWTFDSTTIPNGTYIYYPEYLAAPLSIDRLQPVGAALVVGNGAGAFSTAAQWVPCCTTGSHKPSSPAPDRLYYDGVPNPVHTTYPVAYAAIAGSSSPAYRDGNDGSLWYIEIKEGPRNLEYIGNPQWATCNLGDGQPDGGVIVDYIDPTIISNEDEAYLQVTADNPRDGTRLNSMVHPFTNYVEDPNLGGVWWGANANGQIFKIDRAGNVTTVVGFRRKPTALTYRHVQIQDPQLPTEDQIDTKRDVVGTFTWPGGGFDIGGANDLVFDPRNSDYLYAVSQSDHFVAMIRVSTQIVTVYAGIPGTSGYTEGAAGPTGVATFFSPTSIEMDASGNLYVSDPGNYAIRKITSTGLGVAGVVSTFLGGTAGPTPPAPSVANAKVSLSITSITWSGATTAGTGTGSVVLPVAFSPAIALGTTLQFTPLLGDDSPSGANYTVTAITGGGTTLTIIQTPDAYRRINMTNGVQSGGPRTADRFNVDIYSPPGSVAFASAYIVSPQVLRLTSNGNLLLGESAYDTIRLISFNTSDGQAANTVTRVGCFGNHTNRGENPPIGAWLWMDCDKAGMVGPLNDIIISKNQDNYSAAHYNWRISLSFTSIPGIPTYSQVFAGDTGPLPSYGPTQTTIGGPGHYPWAIAISRKEGRMISNGIAMFQNSHWRFKQPGDPTVNTQTNVNFNNSIYDAGYGIYVSGTVPGFPGGARPAFSHLWGGHSGSPWILNTTGPALNTFDDFMAYWPSTTPGDANDVALAAYIQAGMGGQVPRPEITGNDLRNFIYWIRRSTMQGSVVPTQPGPGSSNKTPPVITAMSAVRSPSTTLAVSWTTSVPTIGLAGASGALQALTYNCFQFRSTIESAFVTNHSVTIDVPASGTLYYTAVARDIDGNTVYAAIQNIS